MVCLLYGFMVIKVCKVQQSTIQQLTIQLIPISMPQNKILIINKIENKSSSQVFDNDTTCS